MDYDELERDWDEPYEPDYADGVDDPNYEVTGCEYEDDGQPDEAQEWHDFDPDC